MNGTEMEDIAERSADNGRSLSPEPSAATTPRSGGRSMKTEFLVPLNVRSGHGFYSSVEDDPDCEGLTEEELDRVIQGASDILNDIEDELASHGNQFIADRWEAIKPTVIEQARKSPTP